VSDRLINANGEPLKKTVTITHEQILAVFGTLLGTQLGIIVQLYKIPPPVLAERLMQAAASLVSPAQPMQARRMLAQELMIKFSNEVDRQAADIGAINPQNFNG
jgi:hypothetical protein